MKAIMVGACGPARIYRMDDPDVPYEVEIEAATVKALTCLFPNYQCVVFTGSFEHEGRVFQPDLALVANDYSHWFVIEVELISHSLKLHVLPQVTAFRYGDPQSDCARIFQRELRIDAGRARTLIAHVPRSVIVIANKRDPLWETMLSAHDIQFGVVSTYRTAEGTEAIEFDGALEVLEENLGFGSYSAIDTSLRFPAKVALPDGAIQISDPRGTAGTWLVNRDERFAWITKERGTPSIPDGSSVQLRRTYDGAISMKLPRAQS